MRHSIRTILIVPLIALLTSGVATHTVHADDVVVTDNGSGSTNQVSSSSNTETNIQSSNTSNATNNVTTSSTTGGNNANANTGGNTSVTSGNSSSSVSVANTGNTSSVTDSNCNCQNQSSTTTISGNGSGSTNTTSQSTNSQTTITVNNTAIVENNVHGTANTGGNSANANNGNTTIMTGNISVTQSIINAANNSHLVFNTSGDPMNILKISGNGAGSVDNASYLNNLQVSILQNNIASVVNNILWNLNSGGNSADANNGNVSIKTGDIAFVSQILNDVNYNDVQVDCGCHQTPPPPQSCEQTGTCPTPPGTPTPPSSNTTSGGGSNSSSSGPGQVLAAATGAILPATGTNWLFFALIGNIVMLFLGVVLRLRSGRSPGAAFALAF
jgi:hypothetical protein